MIPFIPMTMKYAISAITLVAIIAMLVPSAFAETTNIQLTGQIQGEKAIRSFEVDAVVDLDSIIESQESTSYLITSGTLTIEPMYRYDENNNLVPTENGKIKTFQLIPTNGESGSYVYLDQYDHHNNIVIYIYGQSDDEIFDRFLIVHYSYEGIMNFETGEIEHNYDELTHPIFNIMNPRDVILKKMITSTFTPSDEFNSIITEKFPPTIINLPPPVYTMTEQLSNDTYILNFTVSKLQPNDKVTFDIIENDVQNTVNAFADEDGIAKYVTSANASDSLLTVKATVNDWTETLTWDLYPVIGDVSFTNGPVVNSVKYDVEVSSFYIEVQVEALIINSEGKTVYKKSIHAIGDTLISFSDVIYNLPRETYHVEVNVKYDDVTISHITNDVVISTELPPPTELSVE